MPLRRHPVITAFALLGSCSPTQLVWHEEPATIDRYRAAFAAAAGDHFVATVPRADWLAMAAATRVLWLGDHHKSQRLHLLQRELLQQLQRAGRPLLLAVEAIGEQDEPWVDAYLAGRIDEWTLRERIRRRWPGSWLDDEALDAAHYRTLLAFAARHRLPVRAIEPTPRLPLAERDPRIAARVRSLAEANPDRLVVVIVGQTHLRGGGDVVAQCGLPALVLGGEATPALFTAPRPAHAASDLLCSDGGMWWFAAVLVP